MILFSAARDRLFQGSTSSLGLGLFRIVYGLVLLGEVLQLIYFQPLVFGELPFLPAPEVSFCYALWAWAAAIVCMILGLRTRAACVVNYVFTLATFSTFQNYEYHADHIYIGLNLLLIFTPVDQRLSFDALLRRIKSGAVAGEPKSETRVASFHYTALVLVGLGLVYIDSFFWKMGETIWRSGLGVWLPLSLPHDTWFSPPVLNAVMNRSALVSLLSDLTLVLEASFIGLMWVRAARPILCLIGVGLHLSIVFAFPIPFFGLSLAAMYLLLAPESWFAAVARLWRRRQPRCIVIVDRPLGRYRRLLLVLEHFDFRKNIEFRPNRDAMDDPAPHAAPVSSAPGGDLVVQHGEREYMGFEGVCAAVRCHPLFWPVAGLLWAMRRHGVSIGSPGEHASSDRFQLSRQTLPLRANLVGHGGTSTKAGSTGVGEHGCLLAKLAIVVFCALMQATLILQTPYLQKQSANGVRITPSWLASLQPYANAFCGICSHPVFLDGHFKNYDRILAVTLLHPDGSETWLPLTTSSGQMDWYCRGRIWCRWVFRGMGPHIYPEPLKTALRDFTGFWAMKNGVDLTNASFKVLVKKYDPQTGWQRNYLLRQTEKPWATAGFVHWRQGQFSAEIADIEGI